MKIINITYKSICLLMLCIAITLSSCNDGIEPNDNAIRFSYETRSLESDYAGTYGNKATIWGYSNNGGWVYNSQPGLEATLNTTDNTFTVAGVDIENNPEYWTNDTYHFYSLWPPIVDSEDGSSAGIRFVNDAEKKGLGFYFNPSTQKDQLVSYFSISGNDAAARTEPVHFEYVHICSKLFFNIKKNSANTLEDVVLLSFSLSGVKKSGTCYYRQKATPFWSPDDEGTITLYQKEYTIGNLEDDYTTISDPCWIDGEVGTQVREGGYLIIPQTLPYNQVAVSLTYGFLDKEGKLYKRNIKEVKDIYLPIQSIKQWEQGKIYRYNITLAAESNRITFGIPTVSSWNAKQGGSTIIIQ